MCIVAIQRAMGSGQWILGNECIPEKYASNKPHADVADGIANGECTLLNQSCIVYVYICT